MNSFEEEIRQRKIAEENADKEREKYTRSIVAFDKVIKSEEGRKVLKVIFDMCPVDLEVFSTDALQTAYLCGRRSIGIELRNLIKSEFGIDFVNNIDKEVI